MSFLQSDVGREIVSRAGRGTITGWTSATNITVNVTSAFDTLKVNAGEWTIEGTPVTTLTPSAANPVGATISMTLGAPGWRAEDVGKYVTVNGGMVRLTAFTSTTIMQGVIETELTSPVASAAYAWTLNASVWGGTNGWPSCGTFFEQRLWLAGSRGFPSTIWGSTIGEHFNFLLGVFDDEAMAYSIGSGEFNAIRHLTQASGLLVLTYGSEHSVRGGQERAIAPTNLQVKSQSNYGSSAVPPQRVGNEIYMVQRAGRKIRALSPNDFDSEKYTAPDMSILAEHITIGGVVDMFYQAEPDGLLCVIRGDGQMGTCTIDRDQDVVGWARQRTQGAFESGCSVPTATGDVSFVVVARVISGVLTRYIERFDPNLNTDSALTGTSVTATATWSGLGHLEGRRVTVKADGIAMASRAVVGGSITIERTANRIEVGLQFIPTLVTLTPDLGTAEGSGLGGNLSINQIIVRLRDSMGLKINYQEIPFRKFGSNLLDLAPAPFTGTVKAGNVGWGEGVAQTIIQQPLPYPMHVLSVITTITVNTG